jgi:D-glycero-alpha-D-manno-heptose-7-phosphate kinase
VIISRTPLRISFAGGGSDLPAFYEGEPGAVVSTTITRYVYITVNQKFDRRIRASYAETEIVERVDDLKHELIREALRMTSIDGAIEITSISDIPSRGTGLGSSSAYTVGLLNAMHGFVGKLAGAERLAREACEIEIERCRRPIGKQDQYSVAFGGIKSLTFQPDGNVDVAPVICSQKTRQALQDHLLLLYTGLTRRSETILAEQVCSTSKSETRARLRRMVALAHEIRDLLNSDKLVGFGELLHENWMEKRQLADGISSPELDAWYETARRHGATGGKILGAGGGGFLLLYAAPDRHAEIGEALSELRVVPMRFEPHGSRLIYVEENEHGESH